MSSDVYDELIDEFKKQRLAIQSMIDDLEKFKTKIDTLLPESLDKRYIRFFEEKIKSVTELFKVMLDMRKEIIKNTKDEFELRRKLNSSDDTDIGIFDIKKIAERVDNLRKNKEKAEQKIVETPTKDISNLII